MVKYLNRKNLRANKTKLIAAVGLAMAIIIMTTSNQLSIFASSTTEDDGNNNDEIPYCDEADPGYNGTCFDSQDLDEITGLAPCKDGSQVQNYKDCPDRQGIR
ncbi:MAG: hypothetical protein ACRD4J_13645 [Nitrososphaeraceae archaeon]|jgi:hypothetical protein